MISRKGAKTQRLNRSIVAELRALAGAIAESERA